ncbi:MAG: hypothetical protein FJZ01_16225 [Candidatus Sericytochromatia bacterium]|nr:hypothetical protein [Candidatus Tanganyikabacteria bacterium]
MLPEALLAVAVTRGVHVVGPAPYLALGGEVGIASEDRAAEMGLAADGFWYVPGETALGASLGGYIRLAPVAGDLGRRFYLALRGGRAFATGTPTYDALAVGAGLGYRHPVDPGHAYVEAGLTRSYLFKYDETNFLLDVARVGFTW